MADSWYVHVFCRAAHVCNRVYMGGWVGGCGRNTVDGELGLLINAYYLSTFLIPLLNFKGIKSCFRQLHPPDERRWIGWRRWPERVLDRCHC